jgi:hypothetical protein
VCNSNISIRCLASRSIGDLDLKIVEWKRVKLVPRDLRRPKKGPRQLQKSARDDRI